MRKCPFEREEGHPRESGRSDEEAETKEINVPSSMKGTMGTWLRSRKRQGVPEELSSVWLWHREREEKRERDRNVSQGWIMRHF